MISCGTKSAEDTRELGAALAGVAKPGDVVLLSGELGSGKTTFAQGFGTGLGVVEPITSPTFVLVASHAAAGPRGVELHHADVYRLGTLQEVIDLGLGELADDRGVVLVEWGDRAAPALPRDFLEVRFDPGPGDEDRSLTLRAVGADWAARLPALAATLARWAVAVPQEGGSP